MPAIVAADFAELLRGFRRVRGLTQAELADRAGLSADTISLLERRLTLAPQKATTRMLCAALDLAPGEAASFVAAAHGSREFDQREPFQALPWTIHSGDLPIPLTSLVGREHDEAALVELLTHQRTRLLTLTGPAGVGKTRLVLRLGATLLNTFGLDVVFVGLISERDPGGVLPAIARALGMHEQGGFTPREALLRALRERRVALLLDNFEQVLPAARDVLDLVIACPRVTVAVTSRSPLNVRGERCYPVAPLALPDSDHAASYEDLRAAPSVALFIERAVDSYHTFDVATLDAASLVADICVRLDGLPLAIELAAARSRHIGLRRLHAQLTQPAFLEALIAGPQDLADHQRTMRSTIAWSYDLLAQREQRLFRWLGVFASGATLEAIEHVCGDVGDALLATLAGLLDASLLQCEDRDGTRRYTLLMTLQAFARERLCVAGEWEEARRRHAEYFLGLAEQVVPRDVDQRPGVMAQVETEYANVRSALTWALETGAVDYGLRMSVALWRFWFMRSPLLEGLNWLERFIACAGPPTSQEEQTALAGAWTGVAAISHRLGRYERAAQAGEMALALRRTVGDKREIAYALNNLANPFGQLHDYERAAALYEESLALHRENDNRPGMVIVLLNLGGLSFQTGMPHKALDYYRQSLALSRELGETDWARALTLNDIGEVYIVLDEPSRSVEIATPGYESFVREHDTFGIATCAFTLGRAHWRLSNHEKARSYLDEANQLCHALGNPTLGARVRYFRASLALDRGDVEPACRDLAQALDDLTTLPHSDAALWWVVERVGTLAHLQGNLAGASRLSAAAIAWRDAESYCIDPAERELRCRDVDRLRSTLGESAWAERLTAGRTLSLENAVTLARHALRDVTVD